MFIDPRFLDVLRDCFGPATHSDTAVTLAVYLAEELSTQNLMNKIVSDERKFLSREQASDFDIHDSPIRPFLLRILMEEQNPIIAANGIDFIARATGEPVVLAKELARTLRSSEKSLTASFTLGVVTGLLKMINFQSGAVGPEMEDEIAWKARRRQIIISLETVLRTLFRDYLGSLAVKLPEVSVTFEKEGLKALSDEIGRYASSGQWREMRQKIWGLEFEAKADALAEVAGKKADRYGKINVAQGIALHLAEQIFFSFARTTPWNKRAELIYEAGPRGKCYEKAGSEEGSEEYDILEDLTPPHLQGDLCTLRKLLGE